MKNAANPRFLGMLRDVMKFNASALATAQEPGMTIRGLLEALGTGVWFRDYYLLPLSGAIWSTPRDRILDFPARTMIQFFENHALLHHTGQHQWYTVAGGSVQYVERVEASLRRDGVAIRMGTPVQGIRRTMTGPEVKTEGHGWEAYDEVVMATHSDDSLALLVDPTVAEQSALADIRYQPNDVVLHCDDQVMPRNRRAWASWNYREAEGRVFVTLNATRRIDPAKIYDQVTMRHPVYDLPALRAQEEMRRINGQHHTWFCGAWMRNGFHEDGLASAADVVEAMAMTGGAPALAAE